MIKSRSTPSLALLASIALPVLSWAGTTETAKAAEPVAKPSITGTLSLTLDSHFVSFGSDTWGPKHHMLFHPSLELNKAINENFKLILGTWWDVNKEVNTTGSGIGRRVQEVDVWFGGAYTTGILTTTALYQQWMYGGQNEQALELKFGLDTLLKPSLLIHQRIGTDGYDKGTVAVLGVSHDIKAGPVTFSIPASVSVETSNYHGGKAGVGFGSIGVTASVPTDFINKDATFSVGVTGYATNKETFPNNKKHEFINLSTGFTIPF
jgi:hypothetical protein